MGKESTGKARGPVTSHAERTKRAINRYTLAVFLFFAQQVTQRWLNYEQLYIWVRITQYPLGNAFYQQLGTCFPNS